MTRKFVPQVFASPDDLSREVARQIATRIRTASLAQDRFVLGVATGSTPLATYHHLIRQLSGEPLDLSRLYTVNLDEYIPMPRIDRHSYYAYMKEHLWEPLRAVQASFDYEKHGYIPDGEAENAEHEADRYEGLISRLGGVDLQLLGIGTNGHIGFNEPGSSGDSITRVVTLAESTRRDNSRHFGGDITRVPRKAITMGIDTILRAKEIFMLATGAAKAGIVEALVSGDAPSPGIPASYVKKHENITLFVDEAAAVRLGKN